MVMSTPFPPEEGIGNYVYNLSRKLIEKSHRVTVITRSPTWRMQTDIIRGVDVFRVPFIPCYPFHVHVHRFFVNKLFKTLESNFDIVHIHTPLCPVVKTSLPVVTTVHSPMVPDSRLATITDFRSLASKIVARSISYQLELNLLRRSNMITAVSKSIAQELEEYGLNPDDVVVVGNGVDEKIFMPAKNKPVNRYILYVGRLEFDKGLFDLLEAGKCISQTYPDVSFIIAGRGRYLDKLKEQTKKTGLQDKFTFLGQVDKDTLVSLYQNATIFIFPSYHEGLPTVIIEAMSCGLPIIATDVRGNRDLISAGENGIIVPPRTPKKIADAISMLLEDENIREKLGVNARKMIEEKYTWDVVSNKVLECYESLGGV